MAGPEQIWSEALRTLERGQRFALATVINVRGSTPREVGAKMIIRDDGQFGTIGGGCGEAEVFRKAEVLLQDGPGARLVEVDLTGDFDQDQRGTCGGIMDVFIDRWSPEADLAMARRLAEAASRNAPAALLTLIDDGARAGVRALIDPDGGEPPVMPIEIPPAAFAQLGARIRDARPGLFVLDRVAGLKPVTHLESAPASSGAPRVFIDPVAGALRLIIVGAGHIAQPLATLGKLMGWHVTVIDDRASFASRERFPAADELIVRPFGPAIDALRLDRYCYLVAVTRGHAFDEEAVRAALRQPCGFVGMIGSRRRVKATLDRIQEGGVPTEQLDRVHAPLGLDLGAETPEEIALAIVAEMVRERRQEVRDRFSLGVKLGRLKPSS
jgi:xanthine dehydrogenase accessory factor